MTIEIHMPRIGHSMEEGTVVEWLVNEGTAVKAGDPLLVVETDKTCFEVEASEAGTLVSRVATPGEDYEVGALLGVLSVDRDKTPPPTPNKPRATPKARRIARERGIILADVTPTGPDGVITVEDVHRVAEQARTSNSATVQPATARVDELIDQRQVRSRRKLSLYERGMVKTMSDVWTEAPLFTQQLDVDFSAAIALRQRWKSEGTDKATISYNDMAIKAVATALNEIPEANAALDGDEKILLADVHIGLAVASEQGLAVPVLRNADQLSLTEILRLSGSLAAKVRDGSLGMDELGPASATISNLGAYGIKAGTSIPNRGQFMLLFLGAVEDRPVVRDGAIVIAPMVTISATYDHRIVEGVTAATLSRRVKTLLETPELLV